MTDEEIMKQLLAEGFVTLEETGYAITPKGKAAIRRGIVGKKFGPQLLIDSHRARLKPPIRRKKK